MILKRKIPIFEILAAKELVQLLPNPEPKALVVDVFKGLLITTSTK